MVSSIALEKGKGQAEPRGAQVINGGVNFSVYSESAKQIFVSVFDERDRELARIPLDGRDGAVHFGFISGIGAGARYGLRADGEFDPQYGLWFDPDKLLIDPYAKAIDRPFEFDACLSLARGEGGDTAALVPKCLVIEPITPVDFQSHSGPNLIYELNVRGYTRQHDGVPATDRGTMAGLTAQPVIDHLQNIGVDTVELMPVAGWIDEKHLAELGLRNAWGYNPIGYFIPDPRLMPGGIADLRAMTMRYREAGISVILDVVYNHTGEGEMGGPTLSLRGLDPHTYYRSEMVDGALVLANDTGTGNTLRTDHPEVQKLVIDSLRYWVEAAGVAGFRFDLGPVLGRGDHGFDPQATLLQRIRQDPLLSKTILIAEPWDPGPGGYQLGAFAPMREWNDRYRDDVRAFWRGDAHKLGALAQRLAGSSEIFADAGRSPSDGVNFLAVHDGFTLADLVTYAHKHNTANGEENRDGSDANFSWNCGVEGPSDDPVIVKRRKADIRALLATLFVSRGLPMLQQGDEFGRSQHGNNNAYAQDNATTWVDWAGLDNDLVDYTAALSTLRRNQPALNADQYLSGTATHDKRDVIWFAESGKEMQIADWEQADGSVLGMQLTVESGSVLVWLNRHDEPVTLSRAIFWGAEPWKVSLSSHPDIATVLDDTTLILPPKSVVILTH